MPQILFKYGETDVNRRRFFIALVDALDAKRFKPGLTFALGDWKFSKDGSVTFTNIPLVEIKETGEGVYYWEPANASDHQAFDAIVTVRDLTTTPLWFDDGGWISFGGDPAARFTRP